MNEKLKTLNVRLPPQLVLALEVIRHRRTLSAGSRITLQAVVAEALEEYVADQIRSQEADHD